MSVLEKTKKPSLLGVIFFSIPMALIGTWLSFMLLASIEPKPFNSVAEYKSHLEENSKERFMDAHYFRGSESTDREWVQKRRLLLTADDMSLVLTDAEINAWIADKFKKPQTSLSDEEKTDLSVMSGVPNFFIDATEGIHFSMLVEAVVFGRKINTMLIGKGYFSGGDATQFHLSELRLNEAKIPLFEKIDEELLEPLLKPLYESDEFAKLRVAWEKVDSVELVANGIRLDLD
jgi:hypothetical protein